MAEHYQPLKSAKKIEGPKMKQEAWSGENNVLSTETEKLNNRLDGKTGQLQAGKRNRIEKLISEFSKTQKSEKDIKQLQSKIKSILNESLFKKSHEVKINKLNCCQQTNDGKTVIAGCSDGQIKIYSRKEKGKIFKLEQTLRQPGESFQIICNLDFPRLFVSASDSKKPRFGKNPKPPIPNNPTAPSKLSQATPPPLAQYASLGMPIR